MQAISIEVQLQYRGTRARLLYQADQRGDSSSLLSRFVMGDFRDLSLMFMGPVKSIDLFQNGCRASWSILSPSVAASTLGTWIGIPDNRIHTRMLAREIISLSIRKDGVLIRTIECKVDKNYPRADPNTPDMLIPLPSTKRKHENMSDDGGSIPPISPLMKRAKPAPAVPAGPQSNAAPRPAVAPPQITSFGQQPMQPVQSFGASITTNRLATQATGNAIPPPTQTTQTTPNTPATPSTNQVVSFSKPNPAQTKPTINISQEQWMAALRQERQARLKAEAELATERKERVRLQQLLDARTTATQTPAVAASKTPATAPTPVLNDGRNRIPPNSQGVQAETPSESAGAKGDSYLADTAKELAKSNIVPVLLEAFRQIVELTDALESKT